jgi:hypothetical protein
MTEHSFKRLIVDTCGNSKAEIIFSAFKKFQKAHVYELKNIEDICEIENDLSSQIAKQRGFTTSGKRFIVDCVINDVVELLKKEYSTPKSITGGLQPDSVTGINQVSEPERVDSLKCGHENVMSVHYAFKCTKCGHLMEASYQNHL